MDVEAAQQETQDAEQALVLDDYIAYALLGGCIVIMHFGKLFWRYHSRLNFVSKKKHSQPCSHPCTCSVSLPSHPPPSTSQCEASERAALVEKLQQENNFLGAKLEVAVCVVGMRTHARSL